MKKSTLQTALVSILAVVCGWRIGLAEEPLHQRIDAQILAVAGDIQFSDQADDAEFLRRVYLDLAGRIPTVKEIKAFYKDASTGKRESLIDRLLASEDYSRNMTERFHTMLMERLGDNEHWRRFLRTSFTQNKPWDEMARAMLHADREDEDARGAAYFLTARLISEGAMAATDVPGLTRDVGRLLAGKDMQCAQCHDHLTVDEYKQREFQGLHAVFLNIKEDRNAKFPAITEGLMKEKHEFMSVFIQQPDETGPWAPGVGEMQIAAFPQGEEYLVPPDRKKKIAGVPKFSPLKELADKLTQRDNVVFRNNIANRLWFQLMGRGLVHSLDEHHAGNPASHPELLNDLGASFAEQSFDMKWLLKEIAMSQAYQRSSVLKGDPPPVEKFAVAHQKRISAEQLFLSTLTATGELANYEVAQKDDSPENEAANERFAELQKLFIKSFANPPREPEIEFAPSVQGTLLSLNDDRVLKLFQRRDGNLVDRLAKLPDDKVADELFLSVLSRPPSTADDEDIQQYLSKSKDREETLSQLAWALWSSNEFFINH